LLEPRSFDAHKNTIAPIIVMLSHSELDIGVSDASMETMKSDDCREMSRSDGNTNSVVAMT